MYLHKPNCGSNFARWAYPILCNINISNLYISWKPKTKIIEKAREEEDEKPGGYGDWYNLRDAEACKCQTSHQVALELWDLVAPSPWKDWEQTLQERKTRRPWRRRLILLATCATWTEPPFLIVVVQEYGLSNRVKELIKEARRLLTIQHPLDPLVPASASSVGCWWVLGDCSDDLELAWAHFRLVWYLNCTEGLDLRLFVCIYIHTHTHQQVKSAILPCGMWKFPC